MSRCSFHWTAKNTLTSFRTFHLDDIMQLILSSPKSIKIAYFLCATSKLAKSFYLIHFQVFEHPHVGKKYKYSIHTNIGQFQAKIRENHLHTGEKGAFQEQILVAPYFYDLKYQRPSEGLKSCSILYVAVCSILQIMYISFSQ